MLPHRDWEISGNTSDLKNFFVLVGGRQSWSWHDFSNHILVPVFSLFKVEPWVVGLPEILCVLGWGGWLKKSQFPYGGFCSIHLLQRQVCVL